MSSHADLLTALAGGLLTGVLFCAALWYSLRGLNTRRSPAAAVLPGSAVRVLGVLAALYMIGGFRGGETAVALLGFVLARIVVSRLLCASLPPGKVANGAARR